MSVEGGGVGGGIAGVGAAVSIGPIEGRFGPSIFGSEITSLSSLLVSEGPVRVADLKNTMPLQLGFNPAGEIRFNNSLEGNVAAEAFSAEAAITEAEAILSQAQQQGSAQATAKFVEENVVVGTEAIMPQAETVSVPIDDNNLYDRTPYCHRLQGSVTTTENALGVQTGSQSKLESQSTASQFKTENKASALAVPGGSEYPKPQVVVSQTESKTDAEVAQSASPQPAQGEQETAEEELVEEQVAQEEPGESLEEEKIGKILYLEDIEVSQERKHEIREAVIKARAEAARLGLKKIAGWLVAKFLPAEHEGNRSQVVKKKGPDGSYQETVEEIAGAGEFASEEKAVSKFDGIVTMKKPVKYGKEGAPVTNKDVARVFKYSIVKPIQATSRKTPKGGQCLKHDQTTYDRDKFGHV